MSKSNLAEVTIPSRAQRGVVLHAAEVHRSPQGDRVRVRVKLERAGRGFYIGTAEFGLQRLGEVRCAALATLQALAHALGDLAPIEFDLLEAEMFEACGQGAVMVCLVATIRGQSRTLMGFSPLIGDAATSAARAVLDGTNRLLGMG